MSELTEAFERRWAQFIQAFERGDDEASFAALRAWVVAWDSCVEVGETEVFQVAYREDVVGVLHIPFPGIDGMVSGLGELRSRVMDLPDVANRFRFEITAYERIGERFAGSGQFRSRGRYSGLVMRLPIGVVWTIVDGKISRVEAFRGRRGALAALRS
jgi:ketosteroid isomerase-like protein